MSKDQLDVNKVVEYKLLNFDNIEQTAECLSKIFTFEEPVTKGLRVSQQQFYVVAEKECQLAAEDGLSFIAIEQATGNVIGFAICRDLRFDCAHMGEVDPLIILPEIAAFVKELDVNLHIKRATILQIKSA